MAWLTYDKHEYVDAILKAKLYFEAKLFRRLHALFREYAHTAIDSYMSYGKAYFPDSFETALHFELDRHYKRVSRYFMQITRNHLVGTKSSDEIQLEISSVIAEYLNGLSRSRGRYIVRTTVNELSDYTNSVISSLTKDGIIPTRRQIASILRPYIDSRNASRSNTIAITETNMIAEFSKNAEIQVLIKHNNSIKEASTNAVKKVWQAVLDADTREAHAQAHGQSVGSSGEFVVGGESLAYPGDIKGSPGNTINCRCTVVYEG